MTLNIRTVSNWREFLLIVFFQQVGKYLNKLKSRILIFIYWKTKIKNDHDGIFPKNIIYSYNVFNDILEDDEDWIFQNCEILKY